MTNTNPEPHDVLVHYTDAQGLKGILEKNTLWATHGGHTNDAEELQTGLKLLEQFKKTKFWKDPDFRTSDFFDLDKLKEQEKAMGADNFWRERIELTKEFTQNNNDLRAKYICSFSETKKDESYIQQNGRLSQWRAYGDYGIVFNKNKLEKIVEKFPENQNLGGLILEPVLYADHAETITRGTSIYNFFSDFVKKYIEWRFKINNFLPADYKSSIKDEFIVHNARLIFCVKNKGFEEEKEHRLGIIYFKKIILHPNEKITIRHNRIVPYNDLFHHDPLPIEKILIGPAPKEEQQRRKAGVDILLRRLGKEHIPVHCSAIPYRG